MDRASLPLECQAVPVSQCLRPCHTPAPHPQPHPASLVLSHHGDRISKWEGLESPHIPPPPTRVPLRPTFCGSWIHMCGGGGAPDVGGRQEGNTGPWGGVLAQLPLPLSGTHHLTDVPQLGSWVIWDQILSMVSFSGFPSSWELYLCKGGGHAWLPARRTPCKLSLPRRGQGNVQISVQMS